MTMERKMEKPMFINEEAKNMIAGAAKNSIDFSGVQASTVHHAREGVKDKVRNRDVDKDSIVIKEVGGEYSRFSFSDCAENAVVADEKRDAASTVMLVTGADCMALARDGALQDGSSEEEVEQMLSQMKERREWEREMQRQRGEQHAQSEQDRERAGMAALLRSISSPQVAARLEGADIPVTQSGIARYITAANMLSVLPDMTEDAMAYMVGNKQDVNAANLYHAVYSGAASRQTAHMDEEAWQEVLPQAERVLEEAGYVADKENLEKARWLFSYDLPINADSMERLTALQYLQGEQDAEGLLGCMLRGMERGMAPEDAPLDDRAYKRGQEFAGKLLEADSLFSGTEPDGMDIQTITARRQLEEIRLRMTMDAAISFADKGIEVDVEGLSKIVNALYEMEDSYYRNLMQAADASATDEQFTTLSQTQRQIGFIAQAPAYVLGTTLAEKDVIGIPALRDEAAAMQAKLEQAGERYETMATEVRRDLGDSIGKAFANMGSLMEELSIPDTEDNRRAVRILAYNHMELSQENIEGVKEYDSKVKELLQSLRPQVTVELIRRGYNPLEMSLDELNSVVRRIQAEDGMEGEERYARYLLQLEKNQDITPEERSGYIGIYRLLHNIEKTDGAVIGAVYGMGGELTVRNLLTALRSKKASGLDYQIDDTFGGLSSIRYKTESITEQIAKAFTDDGNEGRQTGQEASDKMRYQQRLIDNMSENLSPAGLYAVAGGSLQTLMDMPLEILYDRMQNNALPSQDDGATSLGENVVQPQDSTEEYYEELATQLRSAQEMQPELAAFMEACEIPETIGNLIATGQLLAEGQSPVKECIDRINGRREKPTEETAHAGRVQDSGNSAADAENVSDDRQVDDAASINDTVSKLIEDMADKDSFIRGYQQILSGLEKSLSTEYSSSDIDYQKIQGLKKLHKGLLLSSYMAAKESYEIPLVTENSVTAMHLTLVHDKEHGGSIQISMDSEKLGKVQMNVSLKGKSVKGYMICGERAGYEALQGADFSDKLEKAGYAVGQMYCTMENKTAPLLLPNGSQAEGKDMYQVAKVLVSTVSDIERKGI